MPKHVVRLSHHRALILSVFLLLALLPGILLVPQGRISARQASDLSGVKVAVYTGGHSIENLASRTAIISMLEWMNAEITQLSPADMLNGFLAGHSMLVMPGISPYTLADEMTSAGYNIILDFIARGGAYIGIYGGTFFEWDYFELFNVELQGSLPGLSPTKDLITINIHKNETGPNLSNLPDSFSTLSWTGSYFDAPDMSQVTIIASYAQNGLPCMVTFQYGHGAVFLSSPHPEIEEGDSRDGTTFQDGLNDPDSEWDLMRIIACWLVTESGFEPANPYLGVTVVIGISMMVVVIIVALVVYRRRKHSNT